MSTSKDYPKDNTTTSDDVTADPEAGAQVIENDNAEVSQPASKKKRKRKTKPVIKQTVASKRPRREPKRTVQPEAAVVSPGSDVGISKFSINHKNEIVDEDNKPLSEDTQSVLTQHMDELSNTNTCPRGDWRFASRKERCVSARFEASPPIGLLKGHVNMRANYAPTPTNSAFCGMKSSRDILFCRCHPSSLERDCFNLRLALAKFLAERPKARKCGQRFEEKLSLRNSFIMG